MLWDLNKQKIHCVMQRPHRGEPVDHIEFMAQEPILVSSSGADNSIKMWFFDKSQTQPRLLRERSGHACAPHRIRFYGGKDDCSQMSSRHIITASEDGSLRDISLINEF